MSGKVQGLTSQLTDANTLGQVRSRSWVYQW